MLKTVRAIHSRENLQSIICNNHYKIFQIAPQDGQACISNPHPRTFEQEEPVQAKSTLLYRLTPKHLCRKREADYEHVGHPQK
jgi:hypothetical protein